MLTSTFSEHVLRPSASAQFSASARDQAENQSSNLSQPFLGAPSAIKRPSPSPSIKRNKAEKLLKEHGSPPGIRVTAGGRIVPTDLTPLTSPRLPMLNMNRPGNLYGNPHAVRQIRGAFDVTNIIPNGFVGLNALGHACQMVDGRCIVLPIDQSNGQLQLLMAAPNQPLPIPLGFAVPLAPLAQLPVPVQHPILNPVTVGKQPATVAPPAGATDGLAASIVHLPTPTKIEALEKERDILLQTRTRLERQLVIDEAIIDAHTRATRIQEKMELTERINEIRITIKILTEKRSHDSNGVHMENNFQPQSAAAYRAEQRAQPKVRVASQPPFALGGQQVSHTPVNPFFNAEQGYVHEPYLAVAPRRHGQTDATPNELGAGLSNALPKSQAFPRDKGNRRSHALEIKDPRTLQKAELNPRSPNFEPGRTVASLGPVTQFEVPSPSLIASPPLPSSEIQHRFPWFFDGEREGVQNSEQLNSEQRDDDCDDGKYHSSESVSTADFFPNNPQDHSFTKHVFHSNSSGRSSQAQISAFSGQQHNITPTRDWPTSTSNADVVSPASNGSFLRAPHVSPVDMRSSSWSHECNPLPARSERRIKTDSHNPALPPYPADRARLTVSVDTDATLPNEALTTPSMYAVGYQAGLHGLQLGENSSTELIDGFCAGAKNRARKSSGQDTKKGSRATAIEPSYGRVDRKVDAALTGSSPIEMGMDMSFKSRYQMPASTPGHSFDRQGDVTPQRSKEKYRQKFPVGVATPLRSGRNSFQNISENISPSAHLSSGGSNNALIDALRESTLAEPSRTHKQHKAAAASLGYPMSRQPSAQVSLPRDEVLSTYGGNTGIGPALPMGSFRSSVRSSSQYTRQYPTNQVWSLPESRGRNTRSPRSGMSSKTRYRFCTLHNV